MDIGFFGVTANPPHLGYRKIVFKALEKLKEVWISPVFIHPLYELERDCIAYEDRLEMVKILFSDLLGDRVKVVEIDKEYNQKFNDEPYSYRLLSYLRGQYSVTPTLIIGADNYSSESWREFYRHHELNKDFNIQVFEGVGIQASTLRELIREDKWIKIEYMCGQEVAKYLHEKVYCR